jgi:hypothetical protein
MKRNISLELNIEEADLKIEVGVVLNSNNKTALC